MVEVRVEVSIFQVVEALNDQVADEMLSHGKNVEAFITIRDAEAQSWPRNRDMCSGKKAGTEGVVVQAGASELATRTRVNDIDAIIA